MEQGYKKLEIYKISHSLGVTVHKMSLSLPQFERYEEGSQSDESLFKELHASYNNLCGKLLRYIQAVDKEFEMPNFMKEPIEEYFVDTQTSNPQPQTSA